MRQLTILVITYIQYHLLDVRLSCRNNVSMDLQVQVFEKNDPVLHDDTA